MRYIIFIFVFINIFITAPSQEQDKEFLIQFTGRVFDDFIQPLPFAHILVLKNNQGSISDKSGKFSFITQPGDSILFSTLGFKKTIVVIPDTFNSTFFTRDVLLARDTFMIAEVEVYPWKDYEEFKEAFLNLELPENDMDRARRNIALIKTQIILDDSPNPRQNFNQVMEQQYRETFNQGTYPTYQIFNVFAWSKFIEAIKNGDFKNDD